MEVQRVFKDRRTRNAPLRTFLLEPFDIGMHRTDAGVASLQLRFTSWLRALNCPGRFVCWLMPATLDDKIARLSYTAREVAAMDSCRAELLTEYRRHYEYLQDAADYQRSICGIALWTEENPRALAKGMSGSLEAPASESLWPALFEGQYRVKSAPFGHLAPVGRPGGRLLWAILNSYEFLPAQWNFFKPAKALLSLNFPLALSIDFPYTYDRTEGIEAIEANIAAYSVHLAQLRGAEDSRAVQRVMDCRRALQEMNAGDALHKVQVTIAVAAPDLKLLKERVSVIIHHTHSHFLMRQESGELLKKSVGYFAGERSSKIHVPDCTSSKEMGHRGQNVKRDSAQLYT